MFILFNDGRPIVPTEELCWEASRKWGSSFSWLRIQDASRKVQPPYQAPGPWEVTVNTTKEGVYGLVSQDWWGKTRDIIQEVRIMEKRENGRYGIYIEKLNSIRGFLVYISRAYRDMKP